jgi:monoamine oxidase
LCNKTVVDIQYVYQGLGLGAGLGALGSVQPGPGTEGSVIEVYCKENVRPYRGLKCICALPKQVTEKLPLFKPMKNVFAQIVCAPLCRIYSTFPVVRGKTWFSGMPKFTTNNNLRMVIPISEADGVIMISYSDNKYAMYWNDLYHKHGIYGVNSALQYYVKELLDITIKPTHTKVCYWEHGVGYWTVGAHKETIAKQLQQPFPNFYICGENYSAKYQQWMEGALDTSNEILKLIE